MGSAAIRREDEGAGPLWIWLAILAIALLARLAFVAIMPRVALLADAAEYEQLGRQLAEHGNYGLQTLRPPGYPTFIALVYVIFGKSLLALRVVEAVVGTLFVGLISALGARIFGRTAGLIAAAFAALHPMLAFLPTLQYTENTGMLVLLLAFIAAVRAQESGQLWRWAISGALYGVAILFRPNAIALLPGLALGFALLLRRERRGWALPLAVTIGAFLLALAPWIVRDHAVHGRWYYVTTGGGRQFWAGNHEGATAATSISPPPDSAMKVDLSKLPDEFARDHYHFHVATEFIRQHPARAAWLYLLELRNLFALYPDSVTRTFINRWSRWTQGLASIVIFAGALLALRRWRTSSILWPMVLAIASYSLINSIVFSSLRYRLVFEPFLLLMAGLGWAAVFGRARSSHSSRS